MNFLDAVLPFVLVGVGCGDIILLHDTVAWRKPGLLSGSSSKTSRPYRKLGLAWRCATSSD